MKSNFSFLEKIDKELFEIIEDAQKLFRDEYFSQCVIQTRIFAEKMARKIITVEPNSTFDNVLQCLKDKIKTEREQEFIEDLFFIKKEGNLAAHGADIEASTALEVIQHAFEASINYAYAKTKDEEIDKLLFDTTLLITQVEKKDVPLVEKYLEAAQKEELLNQKQAEFETKTKNKKQLNPTKELVKEKIKKAKKNLRQNINKSPKKITSQKIKKKPKKKQNKKSKNNYLKPTLFFLFVLISILFLLKIFCVF